MARDRAEPSLDQLSADDLGELSSPPLPGKAHPPADKDDATPTLDDEVRGYRHHPNDAAVIAFGFDPEAADAAADLAGDLGSQFLQGATRGEDMSDRALLDEDRSDAEMPFLIEEELGGEEGAPIPGARAVDLEDLDLPRRRSDSDAPPPPRSHARRVSARRAKKPRT